MWTAMTGGHREDLKQSQLIGDQLKDEIFKQQLAQAMKKHDDQEAMKRTYSEKVDRTKYTSVSLDSFYATPFTVEGDDQYKSLLWKSMMKDASFYFDQPSLEDEQSMRKKLQFRYDSLFSSAMRPPLQTRTDLVQWTC